jgi:hypothetical protein
MSRRLSWAALGSFAGFFAAFSLMIVHAISTGAWAAEREFVFHLPLLILPYRQLPIPYPSGENMQWATNGIAIVLIALAGVFTTRAPGSIAHQLKRGVLLLGPLTLLPYSLNRADRVHFLPVTAMVMISLLLGAALWNSRRARILLCVGLTLVSWPLVERVNEQASLQGLPLHRGIYADELTRLTAGCTALIPADTKSLFVGEASYQRYLMNMPILYLANPNVRPATSFISDEPGVQNTCLYGGRVSEDIHRAPRPTAVALDYSGWEMEPNLSAHMRSCGRIEAELSSRSVETIGACVMVGRVFRVGVIR